MNTQPTHTFRLTDNELALLDKFIKGTSLYIEELEDAERTEMPDFWQQRANAMRVISQMLIQRITGQ